jgi:hypothetical protein
VNPGSNQRQYLARSPVRTCSPSTGSTANHGRGKLPSRFLILSNELPRFGDASGAIANRFVVLAMHLSFLGKENHTLTEELTAELAGILSWSLDGLDRLNQQGKFTEPKASTDSILALQDLVSPVAAYVRDNCDVGIGHQILIDDLSPNGGSGVRTTATRRVRFRPSVVTCVLLSHIYVSFDPARAKSSENGDTPAFG